MSTTTELKPISEMTANEIADMMESGCVKMENVAPMYVRAIELLRRSAAHGESKVPQFIVRDAERAIDAATNPKGMHTNGPAMARIEASRLAALLRHAQINSAAPAQAGSAESEREEDQYVINRLATILADIAIALKGPELPLHRHGYHDLAEKTQVLVLERDLLRHQVEELRAALSAQGRQSEDARDAARYRWLRDHEKFASVRIDFLPMDQETRSSKYRQHRVCWHVEDAGWIDEAGDGLDAAIDAAMLRHAAMSTPIEKEQG